MRIQNKKHTFLIIEAALVLGFSGLAWWFLFQHAGGPMSWDEVQYMALSLNPEPQAHILNRYFHIYFQRLFFLLAGSPLVGARLFWSFLIASSIALIYLNARLLNRNGSVLPGIVAVILFFTYPPLIKESGVTYADITVMMLFTLALTIYLIFQRSNKSRPWLLIFLGLVYFFSIKSKETGIALAVIFPGLGFSAGGQFEVRRLVKNLAIILIGMLLGQFFLMLLDRIILGDILFSVRPENFRTLREFNFVGKHMHTSENWYESIFALLNLPFWLMVLSFKFNSEIFVPQEKVLWLLPFGLIGFLNISMINGMWGAITRYYWPAVSVIVILASQFMDLEPGFLKSSWSAVRGFICVLADKIPFASGIQKPAIGTTSALKPIAILLLASMTLAAGVVVVFLAQLTLLFSRAYGWYLSDFLSAIIYPLALSVLLLVILFFKRWNGALAVIALTCLVLIPICTGYGNMRDFVKNKIIAYRDVRFMPYILFEDQISCLLPEERIFFSESLYTGEPSYLGSNSLNSSWMFNLFFSCDIHPSQVTVSAVIHDLLFYDYEYGIISEGDFQGLDEPSRIALETRYNLSRHQAFDVILLLPFPK